jgi:ABC-type long-subunit fatty acid transport system fused permease/ATPase subunit
MEPLCTLLLGRDSSKSFHVPLVRFELFNKLSFIYTHLFFHVSYLNYKSKISYRVNNISIVLYILIFLCKLVKKEKKNCSS